MAIKYADTVTFVRTSSDGYGANKTAEQQVDVPVTFIQSVSFSNSQNQENLNADAICYPDPTADFIEENFNRLEGMFVIAALFGADATDSWYRVEAVTVNRDHLLNNRIDNIELSLKKTKPISGVS